MFACRVATFGANFGIQGEYWRTWFEPGRSVAAAALSVCKSPVFGIRPSPGGAGVSGGMTCSAESWGVSARAAPPC